MAIRAAAAKLFADIDYVISPVSPVVNFAAEFASPINDPDKPFEHIGYTVPWNMSENPAVSINGGYDANGFPIGVQIVGRRFDDHRRARHGQGVREPARPAKAVAEAAEEITSSSFRGVAQARTRNPSLHRSRFRVHRTHARNDDDQNNNSERKHPMAYETIKYEVAEQILTITLNRPDKLNAFNATMQKELIDAFDAGRQGRRRPRHHRHRRRARLLRRRRSFLRRRHLRSRRPARAGEAARRWQRSTTAIPMRATAAAR